MPQSSQVVEYKCPCCSAGLTFGSNVQKLTCEYCDSEFEIDAVLAYNEALNAEKSDEFTWEPSHAAQWAAGERESIQGFVCPSCAGQILTDATTAATFCPYCDNPTIMPARLEGILKPDAIIPFKTSKEDAKAAFLKLCKGKPLLPKLFTSQQRLEKITGMYVPFWLYDCEGSLDGSYKATRVHTWSDSRYHYTKTDHFLLNRQADAAFTGIPMDGSAKMDDVFMESIEPYDYGQLVDFDTAYLSGFLADRYDVPAEDGKERVRQRVSQSLDDLLQKTFIGYATVVPTSKSLNVSHSKARYVLLPVWMLNTRYKDKLYTFAMNGQTGKMTGSFPVCPKRATAWFAGIAAAVSLIASVIQLIAL